MLKGLKKPPTRLFSGPEAIKICRIMFSSGHVPTKNTLTRKHLRRDAAKPTRRPEPLRKPEPSAVRRPQPVPKRVPDSEFEATPVMQLRAGQRIEHNRFGYGMIVEITGGITDLKAKIAFDEHGEKILLLKYAKIRVIELSND